VISGSHGGEYDTSVILRRVVSMKLTDVSDVVNASITKAQYPRRVASVCVLLAEVTGGMRHRYRFETNSITMPEKLQNYEIR
jgi:hypothetical protein